MSRVVAAGAVPVGALAAAGVLCWAGGGVAAPAGALRWGGRGGRFESDGLAGAAGTELGAEGAAAVVAGGAEAGLPSAGAAAAADCFAWADRSR